MSYTEEELIEEVHRVSKEYCDGGSPTIKNIKEHGKYSFYAYKQKFGTWNECLKKSDFSINIKQNISKKDLIQELHKVSKKHCNNNAPSRKTFEKHGNISSSTFTKNFGSWNKALKEAGYVVNVDRKKKITKRDKIEDIKKVSEEHCNGEAPKQKDMEEYGEYSVPTYISSWGSWNECLEELGYNINRRNPSNLTKKDIIEEIQRVNEKCEIEEKPCTLKEFEKKGNIPVPTIQKIFGSWSNAIEESGYGSVGRGRGPERQKKKYEDLKDNYVKVSDEYCGGGTPNKKDLIKHGKYSSSVYERRFGGLRGAAKEFNFKPPHQSDWVLKGANHPSWKGGHSGYYGESYNRRKWDVRERDNDLCRICGSNDSTGERLGCIDVHHITPVRYWNVEKEHEKMNHPRNLISLCRSCHSKLEGKFKGRNHEEFEELAKDYLDIDEKEEKQSIFDY